jgi:hypothetical protein
VVSPSLSFFEPVLEIVDEGSIVVTIKRNTVDPFVDMGPALGIHILHMHDLTKGT